MTFKQHKPEISSDKENLEHPPWMYTAHLQYGDLEGIWIPCTPSPTILNEFYLTPQDKFDKTSRSQSIVGNFQPLHISDPLASYGLQQTISFPNLDPGIERDLQDDNGYPFWQFYVFFGYEGDGKEPGIEEKNGAEKAFEGLIAKRRARRVETSLSREEKESLKKAGGEGL